MQSPHLPPPSFCAPPQCGRQSHLVLPARPPDPSKTMNYHENVSSFIYFINEGNRTSRTCALVLAFLPMMETNVVYEKFGLKNDGNNSTWMEKYYGLDGENTTNIYTYND